ncbi:hypothetical protein EB796_006397 [Bugula neritina]|uniref:Uncharacterized protein n=1 Tax=Bugula neritina TaxID=10212 RepID=A0A7J7K9H2_BUGNE|nr:hypothetical protein EB796_006397 [Bugula neritina]
MRRVQKLSSMMGSFSCDEILEAAIPRFRKDGVSLYRILETGLAAPPGERPSYTRMLQLYTELQGKMIEMGRLCLRSITQEDQVAEDKEAIQITSERIAHSLCVEPGLFEVSDLPEPEVPEPEETPQQPEVPSSTAEAETAASSEPDLSSVAAEKEGGSLQPASDMNDSVPPQSQELAPGSKSNSRQSSSYQQR